MAKNRRSTTHTIVKIPFSSSSRKIELMTRVSLAPGADVRRKNSPPENSMGGGCVCDVKGGKNEAKTKA
jgi:hypothetical protein